MAILGKLVKNIIDLGEHFVEQKDPIKAQEGVLRELLNKAQFTQFGKEYNFSEILMQDDLHREFAEKVPYHSYSQISEHYWSRSLKGEKCVCWPGEPAYFALSSGTTGKESKRIPVTKEMLESIQKAGRRQVLAMKNFDLPDDFFEKEIMMLSSSTDLKEGHSYLEGEISAISVSNLPFWFRSYYKPGEEIAAIDDWDERIEKIIQEAPNWDIGALSGIPSWIELMLEKIIGYYGLENIHELWPNLAVYTSGGVAFGPYEKSFNSKLGRPIYVIDTYLASEGFFASQMHPNDKGMRLFTDNGIFFEFVPFKPEHINGKGEVRTGAPALTIGEVEDGEEYVLMISSCAGAWRYMIGDTVRMVNSSRTEIEITGRTKFFLNKVGSQLSVQKMDDAIQELEDSINLAIREYTVSAQRDENNEFHHYWFLGIEGKVQDVNEEKLARHLDCQLKASNKNYKVARTKALKGVKVKALPYEIFHEWNEYRNKKGGQVKMEKELSDDQFEEWIEFVEQEMKK